MLKRLVSQTVVTTMLIVADRKFTAVRAATDPGIREKALAYSDEDSAGDRSVKNTTRDKIADTVLKEIHKKGYNKMSNYGGACFDSRISGVIADYAGSIESELGSHLSDLFTHPDFVWSPGFTLIRDKHERLTGAETHLVGIRTQVPFVQESAELDTRLLKNENHYEEVYKCLQNDPLAVVLGFRILAHKTKDVKQLDNLLCKMEVLSCIMAYDSIYEETKVPFPQHAWHDVAEWCAHRRDTYSSIVRALDGTGTAERETVFSHPDAFRGLRWEYHQWKSKWSSEEFLNPPSNGSVGDKFEDYES